MTTRSRKVTLSYRTHLKKKPTELCEFCTITTGSDQLVTETKSFKIICNIFPYSYWDLQGVADHLMIVPKKHTDSLNDLNAQEAVEYVDLLGSYESRGYNVYARAPGSNMKTIVHQHTHLILGSNKEKRFILFLKKPYFRLLR